MSARARSNGLASAKEHEARVGSKQEGVDLEGELLSVQIRLGLAAPLPGPSQVDELLQPVAVAEGMPFGQIADVTLIARSRAAGRIRLVR